MALWRLSYSLPSHHEKGSSLCVLSPCHSRVIWSHSKCMDHETDGSMNKARSRSEVTWERHPEDHSFPESHSWWWRSESLTDTWEWNRSYDSKSLSPKTFSTWQDLVPKCSSPKILLNRQAAPNRLITAAGQPWWVNRNLLNPAGGWGACPASSLLVDPLKAPLPARGLGDVNLSLLLRLDAPGTNSQLPTATRDSLAHSVWPKIYAYHFNHCVHLLYQHHQHNRQHDFFIVQHNLGEILERHIN